jgi:hypothetical protein
MNYDRWRFAIEWVFLQSGGSGWEFFSVASSRVYAWLFFYEETLIGRFFRHVRARIAIQLRLSDSHSLRPFAILKIRVFGITYRPVVLTMSCFVQRSGRFPAMLCGGGGGLNYLRASALLRPSIRQRIQTGYFDWSSMDRGPHDENKETSSGCRARSCRNL